MAGLVGQRLPAWAAPRHPRSESRWMAFFDVRMCRFGPTPFPSRSRAMGVREHDRAHPPQLLRSSTAPQHLSVGVQCPPPPRHRFAVAFLAHRSRAELRAWILECGGSANCNPAQKSCLADEPTTDQQSRHFAKAHPSADRFIQPAPEFLQPGRAASSTHDASVLRGPSSSRWRRRRRLCAQRHGGTAGDAEVLE